MRGTTIINIKFLALKNCYKSRIRRCRQNAKILQSSLDELYYCRSTWRFDLIKKKAIAFKLRENTSRNLCYITWKANVCFLDRLIHLALPRIRDFQGISPKVLMVLEITV
jgi:ribosomal protein L5